MPKSIPLTEKKICKYSRGTYETTDGMIYLRWLDNATVIMLSMRYGIKNKKMLNYITSPIGTTFWFISLTLFQCNKYMEGTEAMDQSISIWLVDAAMQNSWVL